jgi:lipoprotein NlpD
LQKGLALFLFLLLLGCAGQSAKAPVTDIWRQPLKKSATYIVEPGDTLYSIAWAYGLDYRQVAMLNAIKPPAYHIEAKQKLQLMSTSLAAPAVNSSKAASPAAIPPPVTLPAKTPAKVIPKRAGFTVFTPTVRPTAPVAKSTRPVAASAKALREGIAWIWPARGKIVSVFASNSLNKGIDISGKAGSPVIAAAAGKVVYAGSGLRGYGALIIIKHSDEFLSAYAHNQKILVREGQQVTGGQAIAKMGATEAHRVALHFEIRKAGQPVDPLKYLPGHV